MACYDEDTGVIIVRFDTHSFSLLSVDYSGNIPEVCESLLETGIPNRAAELINCLVSHGFEIATFDPVDSDNNLQSVVYTLVRH